MLDLQNTRKNWEDDLKQGNNNIIMIARFEDKWILVDHEKVHHIQELSIMIDEGYGLRYEYAYSDNRPNTNPLNTTIIVHLKELKMIVNDSSGFYGFGFPDVTAPAKELFISFRTTSLRGSISARQNTLIHEILHM